MVVLHRNDIQADSSNNVLQRIFKQQYFRATSQHVGWLREPVSQSAKTAFN